MLLRSPLEQRHGAQAHVHRHGDPQVRVDRFQFFAGQPQADVIHALAAVPDREGQSQDPKLSHSPQHPLDGFLAPVKILDHRRDFLRAKSRTVLRASSCSSEMEKSMPALYRRPMMALATSRRCASTPFEKETRRACWRAGEVYLADMLARLVLEAHPGQLV